MFPNAVMKNRKTWRDILSAMIAVREAHGWKEPGPNGDSSVRIRTATASVRRVEVAKQKKQAVKAKQPLKKRSTHMAKATKKAAPKKAVKKAAPKAAKKAAAKKK
jgi:hypothetical protein